MHFKTVSLRTKCSEPEMTRYLHIYMHHHLPNALGKFAIDLVGGENWNTQSFRKNDQLLNMPKFQKEQNVNNISHKGKLLLFFERRFALGN